MVTEYHKYKLIVAHTEGTLISMDIALHLMGYSFLHSIFTIMMILKHENSLIIVHTPYRQVRALLRLAMSIEFHVGSNVVLEKK